MVDPKNAGLGRRQTCSHYTRQDSPPFFKWAPQPATAASMNRRHSSFLPRLLLIILLFIGNIHPHPGPPPAASKSIITWNCNGLRNSVHELSQYLDANGVKVACIQETKLTGGAPDPNFPNYAIVRRDRPTGGGGGLVTLIHHSLTYIELPSPFTDAHTECIVIKLTIAELELVITNIYIPPASSCAPGFAASLSPLLNEDHLILGDINGHADQWSIATEDARGISISDELDDKNFLALNDPDFPTRPSSDSSPDVAIVPASLALLLNYTVDTALNSDHLPIAVLVDDDSPPIRTARSFVSFRKADWKAFKKDTERQFGRLPLPSSCAQGEKVWRRVLQKASARHVPSGFVRSHVPDLGPAAKSLIRERDRRRQADPDDPALPGLSERILAAISQSSREKWMEAVKEADRKANPNCFWRLLRGLSGKRVRQHPNQPIKFHNKTYTKRGPIANQFCKQYVNGSMFRPSRNSRNVYRQLKSNALDSSYTPFTFESTLEAVKACRNSPAIGPNGLATLHIKHIGEKGLRFLTRLFNLSVRDASIPTIWKSATIIPVPKPGKSLDEGLSYRPISLLCPEAKILEHLLLPELRRALHLNTNQHGFRSNHSTVTALLPIVTTIAKGFNAPKPASRTGLLSVDLSKAFDVIDRDKLLLKVDETDMHPNVKRFLTAYMRDRKTRVSYQGSYSKWRKSRLGVFQGSKFSPWLYNFYVADWEPTTIMEDEVDQSYADDMHSGATSSEIPVIASSLNPGPKIWPTGLRRMQ